MSQVLRTEYRSRAADLVKPAFQVGTIDQLLLGGVDSGVESPLRHQIRVQLTGCFGRMGEWLTFLAPSRVLDDTLSRVASHAAPGGEQHPIRQPSRKWSMFCWDGSLGRCGSHY